MSEKIDLASVLADVTLHGPRRVMIDAHEAVNPTRAERDYDVVPTVIFVRADGWTLGAPAYLEAVAEKHYPESWIAVLRRDGAGGRWDATPYARRNPHA